MGNLPRLEPWKRARELDKVIMPLPRYHSILPLVQLSSPFPSHLIMAEVQNSNPTILNAADLPTRSRPTAKSGDYGSGIFAAVPNPADFLSSDSEQDDDDLLEEPIDEQEIYGQASPFPFCCTGLF